ncbi:hypothetical protein AB0M44_44805 [Streptosporangium subroseum]|uniref:hypothetical protein n=1 Tax=Streptosporangium subroseum TaxID=106412 RepID=UPI003422C1EF
MATDLGDALTAYWRSGEWWGSPELIIWLINNGHMSEAEYALREVMQVKRIPDKRRQLLLRQGRRLQALERRAQQQPMLPPADALPDEHLDRPSSNASTAASGAAAEPS